MNQDNQYSELTLELLDMMRMVNSCLDAWTMRMSRCAEVLEAEVTQYKQCISLLQQESAQLRARCSLLRQEI